LFFGILPSEETLVGGQKVASYAGFVFLCFAIGSCYARRSKSGSGSRVGWFVGFLLGSGNCFDGQVGNVILPNNANQRDRPSWFFAQDLTLIEVETRRVIGGVGQIL